MSFELSAIWLPAADTTRQCPVHILKILFGYRRLLVPIITTHFPTLNVGKSALLADVRIFMQLARTLLNTCWCIFSCATSSLIWTCTISGLHLLTVQSIF